jgi:thioredoxin 1
VEETAVSLTQLEQVPYVTTATFDQMVIDSPLPVLVNFETPWSKGMVPLLGQLAEAFAGQLRVVRANISADSDLATRFKIRAVPTLLIFKNGVPVEFIVGTVPSRFIFEIVCKTVGAPAKVTKARRSKTIRQWPWRLALDSTLA